MRDVRDVTVTHHQRTYQYVYQFGNHDGTGQWYYKWMWRQSGGAQEVHRKDAFSRRSDSVSTPPVNGEYVLPTAYEAVFLDTSTLPGTSFWDYAGYRWRGEWTGWPDRGFWNWGLDPFQLPSIPEAVRSRAISKVMAQLKGNTFDIAVAAAEARMAFKGIYDLMRQAVTLVRGFRRFSPGYAGFAPAVIGAKRSSRRRAAKVASQHYLAWKYGLLPLMSDIHSMAEVIQNGIGAGAPVGTCTGIAMDDDFAIPTSFPGREFTGSCQRGIEVSYTFGLTDVNNFQLWRYGVTNPLLIAWELTTFSFVVDWFLGVGAFLEGLIGPHGVKVLHGYETKFHKHAFTMKERAAPTYGTNVTGDLGVVNFRGKSSVRVPRSFFLGADPYFDLGLRQSEVRSLVALFYALRK